MTSYHCCSPLFEGKKSVRCDVEKTKALVEEVLCTMHEGLSKRWPPKVSFERKVVKEKTRVKWSLTITWRQYSNLVKNEFDKGQQTQGDFCSRLVTARSCKTGILRVTGKILC